MVHENSTFSQGKTDLQGKRFLPADLLCCFNGSKNLHGNKKVCYAWNLSVPKVK